VVQSEGRARPGELSDVLELKGLTRRYGDLVALDDLSFTVREGQMFGFVGPNGAGKTTAMRIVLGVLEADAGQVFWRGSPIDEQTRRRTGYMPEDHGQTFSTQCASPSRGSSGACSVSSVSRRITGMSRSGLRQRPSSGVYRVAAAGPGKSRFVRICPMASGRGRR
jgi:ABC-type molybdenum transport system ATPase subunit/photorepair protein PhrA